MNNSVQLITYVDRLGQNLAGIKSLINNEFSGLFGAVHLLPFFYPIDGADAGFDPSDHTIVDPRLGDWEDIKKLTQHTSVMADLIVNHISSDSAQFQDVKKHAEKSDYWDLFLRKDDVFQADASEDELEKILRLHSNAPFLPVKLDNGQTYTFWSTFSDKQLDINVESAAGKKYLTNILDTFSAAGIKFIRLDAAGFAIKRRNTSCFMLPETFAFLEELTIIAAERGMQVLVEIHSHYQTQIEIAKKITWVYDFALPALVLHTLFSHDSNALKNWLRVSPRNCLTVLDTHDGIGMIDAGSEGDLPGLLSDKEIQAVRMQIETNTKGESVAASGDIVENLDVSQVNTTYYDALGSSDQAYLIARAIQLFVPGIPQIYYVGLLAGSNDNILLEKTKNGRDINRHFYSNMEIDSELQKPVVQSLIGLIKIRNNAHAFNGEFSLKPCADDELRFTWANKESSIELWVKLTNQEALITQTENGEITQYQISEQLTSKQIEKSA